MANVLVVDDDPDLTDALEVMVRLKGHDVRVAHDGREALALIAVERPDILICDVEMPVLNGPDAVYLSGASRSASSEENVSANARRSMGRCVST